MQLIKLNSTLKPLTIAAGLLGVSPTFAYGDIDSHVQIHVTSSKVERYVASVDPSENNYLFRKYEFLDHLEKWQNATMFMSSAADIIENRDFQAIVAMGYSAVPYIKEELTRKPSTLVWALNLIYEQKISEKSGLTISEASKLWIKALS